MTDLPEKLPERIGTESLKTERNPSFYMAVLAIVISLVGTCVSIFEARILRDQQSIKSEEKEASVCPYLSAENKASMTGEGTTYSFILTNQGVGPALVGNISHQWENLLAQYRMLFPNCKKNIHP